jgi:hypothetical protein
MVDLAIGELHKAVLYKTNILRADRLELARQHREIAFMIDYLRMQMKYSDPIEFLKLT